MDDAAVCTAYGDVLTILENANLSLDDGRMKAREHEGWYQLATRVLDRLPRERGRRSSRCDRRSARRRPGYPLGVGEDPADVRTPEWYDAEQALSEACDDLDVSLAISPFTGG